MEDVTELVKQLQNGQEEAFETLYQMFYQQAYYQAYKLCRNENDAHDIAQESLLQAYRSIKQLKQPASFPSWLHVIVHSKCTRMFYNNRNLFYDPDQLRKNSLQETRVEHNPKQHLENDIDKKIVHQMVQELSPKLIEVVDLFYFQQRSIQEISEELHLPEGTVKSRIHDARKILKKKITSYENREQRKISFHLEPATPSLLMLAMTKLASCKWMQSDKAFHAVSAISLSTCAIVGTATIVQTYETVKAISQTDPQPVIVQSSAKEQPLDPVSFSAISYHDKEIITPKAAYYALMALAPETEDIQTLTKEQIQEMLPLVNALKEDKTTYQEVLQQRHWFSAFDAITK